MWIRSGLCCGVWVALSGGSAIGQGLSFTDVTQASGISSQFEFPPGVNPPQKMLAGGAVGDFDRDGDQDLFVLSGGGSPDRLYINNGSGVFADQAAVWGVDRAHMGAGAAVADVNGDGWLDIFVTSHGTPTAPGTPGHHALYMNNGDGTFTDRAFEAGLQTITAVADGFGASFGDFDLDGDLDLAVAGWMYQAGGNRLFENNGAGLFTDITAAALPASVFDCRGFSPWFHDMDGDLYPELLWTSDFDTSRYLVNNGDGTFADFTVGSGTGLDSNGMGATIADLNADGLPDWYVTSIDNSASQFRSGNMMYLNQGGHVYTEVSLQSGVNQGGWAWGADAPDFDHDGVADLVWTNGWRQVPAHFDDPTFLCTNHGSGVFKATNPSESGVTHNEDGRGLLTFDADNDGDRDLVIFSTDVPTVLYRNELAGAQSNWLTVALDTSADPALAPDGVGARVEITIAGAVQRRWINASPNYLSQSELSAHFGLAGAATVDTLVVRWQDGAETTLTNLDANQRLVVAAPGPCSADISTTDACTPGQSDGVVTLGDFSCYLSEWSNGSAFADITSPARCEVNSGGDGVTLSDFSCYLSLWAQGCP
ncbi:MAG: CRTAC1 family protein [Planctomycetota bacterium]